jgi:hypothetical protein
LNPHFPRAFGSACPASHLHNQLGRALGGTKVWAEESGVGVYHGYQSHCREVMPFGEHLSANHDARLTLLYALQLIV